MYSCLKPGKLESRNYFNDGQVIEENPQSFGKGFKPNPAEAFAKRAAETHLQGCNFVAICMHPVPRKHDRKGGSHALSH